MLSEKRLYIKNVSNRQRILEIFAVLLTSLGKFIFMDVLNWRFMFILITILLWSAYVYFRSRKSPEVFQQWGFRRDNFRKVTRIVLPFATLSILLCFIIGYYRNTIQLTWHILPILVLYPIWGIIQQFLLIALTAGNLQELSNGKFRIPVILVSAILFGLIHYPYGWLMLGTFLLALFYGYTYLRERNVYVLGIFHGWLAAFYFYTVVGRDPFQETFGSLFNLPG